MENEKRIVEILVVPFSGFYDSIWDSAEENDLDYYEEEGHLKYLDGWGLRKGAREELCDDYADRYIAELNSELGLNLKKAGTAEMVSPKYYNFTTDKIYVKVEIGDEDLERVIRLVDDDKERLRRVIKDRHTSCDGFISFMSNDIDEWVGGEIGGDNELYLSYALWYLLEASEPEFDYDSYEWLEYCGMWEPQTEEAKAEYDKYIEVCDAYGYEQWDAEKWDKVDLDEVKRLCRLKRFENENQLKLWQK